MERNGTFYLQAMALGETICLRVEVDGRLNNYLEVYYATLK